MYGCELHPDMAGLVPGLGLASDNVSEVSTRGSSAYSDSREDLRDLASVLGLPDVDHLCQDRFRVDRRKLEHMLLGDTPSQETAADFFQRIMDETNTLIIWPARLKIGSKSKNDPHVRIAGRPDDVKEAKMKVMSALDVRSNRVTMKLNVSYTDHSHIIGKGGLTIKRVMEDTGCHIHFPDSNRSNPMEKSNQVSIAGDMEGVERARARVRELTPLMFSFELPIVGTLQPLPDPDSPYLLSIQEKYNVQVMFRTRPKLHATLVVVKGCEWEVAQVKEATLLLINHMCETLANQVQVQMSMEISPQHHPIVVGKNSNNLKMIMHRTATQIMFPDAGDPNIPSIKKSNVLITGVIHNVYLARQQLLGALPLVLMFDVPEESVAVDTEQVAQLMQSLDVMINIRHKPKQNTMSVIIKGIERNATNIYEARKQLLGLTEHAVVADVPPTYVMVDGPSLCDFNNNVSKGGVSPFNLLTINTGNGMFPMPSPSSMSPGISPSLMSPGISPGMPWGHFGLLAPAHGHGHHTQALTSQQISQLLNTQMPTQHQHQLLLQQLVPRMQHLNLSQMSMSSHSNGKASSGMSDSGCSGSCSSLGYHSGTNSRLSGSTQSLDCRDYPPYSSLSSNTSSVSSPAASPRHTSPIQGLPDSSKMDLLSFMSENQDGQTGLKKNMEQPKTLPPLSAEYQRKKALAAKTMQMKPVPEVLRIPTSGWSGYGFSHSSPSNALKELKKERTIPEPLDSDTWKNATPDSVGSSSSTPVFSTVNDFNSVTSNSGKSHNNQFSASSYLDSMPSSSLASITSTRTCDLAAMLISIGMEKYIAIFKEHEIDLNVFLSLTDKDLKEIGVSTFGARRTMLMAIAQHKRQTSPFCGSAAPGAERKGSSSTMSNSSPTETW